MRALRTVGNIVTGNDQQTQAIINCGALLCLLHLPQHQPQKVDQEGGLLDHFQHHCWHQGPDPGGARPAHALLPATSEEVLPSRLALARLPALRVARVLCWHTAQHQQEEGGACGVASFCGQPPPVVARSSSSSLAHSTLPAAGTDCGAGQVMEANLIQPLAHLLASAEFDIRKEAAWAISNATSGGTQEQIKFLVSVGCIKPLCDLLTCADARIITVALEGLENILKVGLQSANSGLSTSRGSTGCPRALALASACRPQQTAGRSGQDSALSARLRAGCRRELWAVRASTGQLRLGRAGGRDRKGGPGRLGAEPVRQPHRRRRGAGQDRGAAESQQRGHLREGGCPCSPPGRPAAAHHAGRSQACASSPAARRALSCRRPAVDAGRDSASQDEEAWPPTQAVSILENFFDVEEGEVENLAPRVDAQQGTYSFGGQQNGGAFGQADTNFKFGP